MTIDGNVLTPDTGFFLTNGEIFSEQVWLGTNDSADNWKEVDILLIFRPLVMTQMN